MNSGFRRTVVAIALLILGVAVQAMSRTPPVKLGGVTLIQMTKDGKIDPAFLESQLAFIKERAAYIEALPPPYTDHRGAFLLARSAADYPKIKEAIDREVAENTAIAEAGLGAVPGLVGGNLGRVSIWLMALAAAVAFRSLAFVMGAAFLGGMLQGAGMELNTLTGLTAEHYLASVLAALIIAVCAWWALQRWERAVPV